MMMKKKNDDAAHAREDSFLTELIPQVAEHLAERHAEDFDAEAGQARFETWLAAHTKEPAASAKGRAGSGTRVRHGLLGQLVIPIVFAVVGALSASTLPFLFARGSIGWAFGLWGFAAVVVAAVGILATAPERRRPMWDRVRNPVKTVLIMFLAAALGLGVGRLAFGSRTVNPAAYIGHIVERVNGGGQPNTSWLVESNGERYWIPDTSIFSCLVKEGHTDLGPQSSTVLNDLPDSGKWASCPATVNRAAYIGHIVEWVNGGGQPNTSWLVGSNGERYWIPTASIFYCLRAMGHTDLGPQSSAVLNDLPDSGKWALCP
jgi:hypothetical protein